MNAIVEGSGDEDGGDGDDDEEDPLESIHIDERFSYLEHVLRFMAVVHSLISFFMLIAYYHLKGKSRSRDKRRTAEIIPRNVMLLFCGRSTSGDFQTRKGDRAPSGVRRSVHCRAA